MSESQIPSQGNQLQGKLFSPLQILLGTVLGGIFSGIYFMAKNYEAIGDKQKRNLILTIGSIFTLLFVSLIVYFDVKVSGSAFAGALGGGLYGYSKTFLKANQISTTGSFFVKLADKDIVQSKLHVLGAIIIGIIVGILLSIGIAIAFQIFGLKIS